MKFILAAVCAVLFSSHALALENFAAPVPVEGETSLRPSTPRIAYWKDLWDRGTVATSRDISGTWRRTGFATDSVCASAGKDAYNEPALLNNDSTWRMLGFGPLKTANGETLFVVNIMNLGLMELDQGPYSFSDREPQFAYYGYASGVMTKDGYFEQSCRYNWSDRTEMICMMTLHQKVAHACSGHTHGIVSVYRKYTN